jgi:glycosidase
MILPFLTPQAEFPHTFRYTGAPQVKKVNLAGTFNGWNKAANEMQKEGNDYTLTLQLKPGKYQYKFVLDDNTWVTDPKAPTVDDGNGNTNSVLVLNPPDYAKPAKKGDGFITASALRHEQKLPDLNYDRGKLTISLTTRPNDIHLLSVVANGKSYPMQQVAADDLVARYAATIPWSRKNDLTYFFSINEVIRLFNYTPRGLVPQSPPSPPSSFIVSAKSFRPFAVPNWVEKTVLYQIFPDRFANGDKSNDPANVEPWDAKPTYSNRFGGDFAGVRQHIGYLKNLGIGAVYLNPIFQSPSNHRYETTDYFKVDRELGTNEEFIQTTKDLKKNGIKTILDGVFHITAPDFFAFKDLREKGQASPYTSWYGIHSYPIRVGNNPNYDAWYGYPSMPQLKLLNPATKQYILSVPKYWQKNAEIAGWRLDVAQDLPQPFLRDFRKTVKSIDPNAWVLGEFWGDAGQWLQGDQWDASMNYPFREAVLSLVGKGRSGKPSDFVNRLFNTYALYAPQVSRNQMNLLGSHDTARILTECNGDEDLAKLAAVIQFTWVGTPSIYYGDELGMAGGADPDNRRGMAWSTLAPFATSSRPLRETPNQSRARSFLELYKKLIKLRNSNPVLQSGDPVRLQADDATQTAAYARTLNGQTAIIAINRSGQPRTVTLNPRAWSPEPGAYTDALSGRTYPATTRISLPLRPKSAAILMPRSGPSSHLRLQGQATPGPRRLANVQGSTK